MTMKEVSTTPRLINRKKRGVSTIFERNPVGFQGCGVTSIHPIFAILLFA